MRTLSTSFAIAAFSIHAFGQAGTLDDTFGTDGKVIDIHPYEQALAVVVQSDGKIVTGGYSANGDDDFLIRRYDTDGTPDTDFNGNGGVSTNIDTSGNSVGYDNRALAIVVQPDGKIIAAGNVHNGTDLDVALVRYNSDGTIDSTFNNTGIVQTGVSGNDEARSMVLQPDGKIIVGGYCANIEDLLLARYDADGTLDPTFGIGGIAVTDLGTTYELILSLALQADGKVVAGGMITSATGFNIVVARFNTDGTLDPGFNQTGAVIQSLSSDDDHCLGVAVTATGKIIAVGSSDFYSAFAILQWNSDGTPDPSFGTGGIQITPLGTGTQVARAVLIQPDGKILAGGSTYNGATDDDFALVRYDAFGDLDPAFDLDGIVTTDLVNDVDEIHAMALQPDGRIVAVGYSQPGPVDHITLARYNNDLATGVAAIASDGDGIMIHPNPSAGELTVEWQVGGTALLRVYDVLGAIVMEQRLASPARISIPESGIYFMELTDEKRNVITRKIVIE